MELRWNSIVLWILAAACWGARAAIQAQDPNIRKIPLRSQSLAAPYLDSDMQSRYFEFGEDTIIRADQYIRLASDRQGQTGWLFARTPMTANNWQIEMEFRIHGIGHLHGDGMAIWLTEERGQPGKVFGSKDNFNGLGVFIDTYKNSRPGTVFPYVMAMLGNSSVSYDKDHDGRDTELAGCSARGLRGEDEPQPKRIRLTYYQDTSFRVDLQYKKDQGPDEWTECFETGPIKLPQTAYLGFSAETGELSDNHDIISVQTHNLHIQSEPKQGKEGEGAKPASPPPAHPYNPGGEKERGSWHWFILKIVLFGIVVVGGYVGFTAYRANRRTRF